MVTESPKMLLKYISILALPQFLVGPDVPLPDFCMLETPLVAHRKRIYVDVGKVRNGSLKGRSHYACITDLHVTCEWRH